MRSQMLPILLMIALLIVPFPVECKSYFGIGDRIVGDKLILRDEVQNPHTGLTEVPRITFHYAIKEPITYIEITTDQNVLADINFSYYHTLINGSVTALSTSLQDDNKPFKVLISFYGFTDFPADISPDQLLRKQMYKGSLIPSLEPGDIDHMEMENTDDNVEEVDILEDTASERTSTEDPDNFEDYENEHDSESREEEEDDEEAEAEAEEEDDIETFPSLDKFIVVGNRQKGDSLLYETYQTSSKATELPTAHSVTFYYIDSVNITYIEFVIYDFLFNKTSEETENYVIQYSHFTPSTLKAVITDLKTTSLFAKMSIYGYTPRNLPMHYVSYVPEKVRNAVTDAPTVAESPEMHLRAQINALQRENDFASLPHSFDMHGREEEFQYTITNADRNAPSSAATSMTSGAGAGAGAGANVMQSKITNLSVMMPLLGFTIHVYVLMSRRRALFD